MTHLVRSYGAAHGSLVALVRDRPALGARLDAESPVIVAELAHGAREEMAVRAEDLVCRRTELGQTARAATAAHALAEDQLRSVASPDERGSRNR